MYYFMLLITTWQNQCDAERPFIKEHWQNFRDIDIKSILSGNGLKVLNSCQISSFGYKEAQNSFKIVKFGT